MRTTNLTLWGTSFIVQENGEWYNHFTKKWGSYYVSKDGDYPQITTLTPSGKKTIRLHRFLALAFKPHPNSSKLQVRHMDGNKENFSLDNLEWGTPLENIRDKARHGTQPRGSEIYNSLLSEELVLKIRRAFLTPGYRVIGITAYSRLVSDKVGIPEGGLRDMLLGGTWKHVECPGLPDKYQDRSLPPTGKSSAVLSEENREFIRKLRSQRGLRVLGSYQFLLFLLDRFPMYRKFSFWKLRQEVRKCPKIKTCA